MVAYQDFDTNSGLLSFQSSLPLNSFSSHQDAFGIYSRNEGHATGKPVLFDDSLRTGDKFGVVASTKTDAFFGIADVANVDSGNTADFQLTWNFDISGSVELGFSIDLAAMGDFDAVNDHMHWRYNIDGASEHTALLGSIDESRDKRYLLEDGSTLLMQDPFLVKDTVLTNLWSKLRCPRPRDWKYPYHHPIRY